MDNETNNRVILRLFHRRGLSARSLPKWRVPVAMMELNNLHERGIITPVEHSTDWISSLIVVM